MPTQKFTQNNNILKMLMVLSIPAILSGLVDSLYNTVDSIFVGYFIGQDALAALTVINVIQIMYISVGVLFAVGNGSIVSRALGAKDIDRAVSTLIHSFWANFTVSIVISALLLLNLDQFLRLIGASDVVLPYAKEYGSIILWTGFILPINNMLLAALRAQGKVAEGTKLNIIAAVINIILDALFIIKFGWGVAGAALATAIGQSFLFIVAIHKVKELYHTSLLFKKLEHINFKTIKDIIFVGFPTGMRIMLFVIVFSAANAIISPYGTEYLSAFGIFTRLLNLISMILICLTMGGQPLIGMNYGAQLYDRVKKITLTMLGVGLIFSLVSTILLLIAPENLYRLFTPEENIIMICQEISRISGIGYWCWGIFICIVEALQAMGHAKQSLKLSMLYPISVFIGLIIWPKFIDIQGVWMAFTSSYFLIGLSAVIIIIYDFRMLAKKQENLKHSY